MARNGSPAPAPAPGRARAHASASASAVTRQAARGPGIHTFCLPGGAGSGRDGGLPAVRLAGAGGLPARGHVR
eukprot:39639-Prymnesium_polylepis.1